MSARIRGRTGRMSEHEHRDISQNVQQRSVAKAAVTNTLNLGGGRTWEGKGQNQFQLNKQDETLLSV